jgi:hypothetical protein
VERGHAPAVSAGRAGDATGAIVERGDAVAVSAGGTGDAALGVVEANVLRLGGRERGKRGQEWMAMIRMAASFTTCAAPVAKSSAAATITSRII